LIFPTAPLWWRCNCEGVDEGEPQREREKEERTGEIQIGERARGQLQKVIKTTPHTYPTYRSGGTCCTPLATLVSLFLDGYARIVYTIHLVRQRCVDLTYAPRQTHLVKAARVVMTLKLLRGMPLALRKGIPKCRLEQSVCNLFVSHPVPPHFHRSVAGTYGQSAPHTTHNLSADMPSFQEELVAGTVGGCLGISVVYPLDTVKSRYVLAAGTACI